MAGRRYRIGPHGEEPVWASNTKIADMGREAAQRAVRKGYPLIHYGNRTYDDAAAAEYERLTGKKPWVSDLTGAFGAVFAPARSTGFGSVRKEHASRLEFWVSQLRKHLATAKSTRSKSPGAISALVELEIAKAHVAAESDGAGQFEKWIDLLREGADESMRLHKLLGVI